MFEEIKRNRVDLKTLLLEFLKFKKKCGCHGFPKIMKITKIGNSGLNWRLYLSIKQVFKLEIVIKSLSGRILKNETAEF